MNSSTSGKDIPRKFAEITCLLEDMHGVAVEGHAPNQSDCFYKVLIKDLETGCSNIGKTIGSINDELE
ncbi:hypothetical protein [Parasphingorhabdus sp.]|uniref:hypothetical protein n=1 Tax=Parasphingorhabdus sp. TaxID=2709688 RepID=UPI003D28BAC0